MVQIIRNYNVGINLISMFVFKKITFLFKIKTKAEYWANGCKKCNQLFQEFHDDITPIDNIRIKSI